MKKTDKTKPSTRTTKKKAVRQAPRPFKTKKQAAQYLELIGETAKEVTDSMETVRYMTWAFYERGGGEIMEISKTELEKRFNEILPKKHRSTVNRHVLAGKLDFTLVIPPGELKEWPHRVLRTKVAADNHLEVLKRALGLKDRYSSIQVADIRKAATELGYLLTDSGKPPKTEAEDNQRDIEVGNDSLGAKSSDEYEMFLDNHIADNDDDTPSGPSTTALDEKNDAAAPEKSIDTVHPIQDTKVRLDQKLVKVYRDLTRDPNNMMLMRKHLVTVRDNKDITRCLTNLNHDELSILIGRFDHAIQKQKTSGGKS